MRTEPSDCEKVCALRRVIVCSVYGMPGYSHYLLERLISFRRYISKIVKKPFGKQTIFTGRRTVVIGGIAVKILIRNHPDTRVQG